MLLGFAGTLSFYIDNNTLPRKYPSLPSYTQNIVLLELAAFRYRPSAHPCESGRLISHTCHVIVVVVPSKIENE